jgi:hypothetical protein
LQTTFWFALVLGGGLLLLSLLGDLFGTHGDGDLDHASDHGDGHGLKILSLRTLTYALFGYGAVGTLLAWLQGGEAGWGVLVAAIVTGIAAAVLNEAMLGFVRRTQSGALPGDDSLAGLMGRVTLPLGREGTGKITVERSGREHELLARPFEAAEGDPERWTTVVVIEMKDGVAHVAPLDEA